MIFALLDIPSPFRTKRYYPSEKLDVFMALAVMALYKAAYDMPRGQECSIRHVAAEGK